MQVPPQESVRIMQWVSCIYHSVALGQPAEARVMPTSTLHKCLKVRSNGHLPTAAPPAKAAAPQHL